LSIKASELPDLKGKLVVVQITVTGDDDEDFREVSGKVLAATSESIAIQPPRGKLELIMAADIIDIEIMGRVRRLVKRWIEDIDEEHVRQHFVDRHGTPMDLVRTLSDRDALKMHGAVNHDALGHGHGERPVRPSGRPPRYTRPVD
jgi:hypothetical protein